MTVDNVVYSGDWWEMDNLPSLHPFDTTHTSTLGIRIWCEDFELASQKKESFTSTWADVKATFRALSNKELTLELKTSTKRHLMHLPAHFSPKQNKIFETIKFCRERQRNEETVTQYSTWLHDLTTACDFVDIDRLILTQIILTCTSNTLRRWTLEKEITLEELLHKAPAFELLSGHLRPCRRCPLSWPWSPYKAPKSRP